MIEEEFEDVVELVGHLCYAIEVDWCMYERCVVVILTTSLGGQIRKVVASVVGSVVVFVFSWIIGWFLPDDGIEWIKVEYLCLFLYRLEFLELDLYLYIYLNRTIDDCRKQTIRHLWTVLRDPEHVADIGDLRRLRLPFMWKVLHEKRPKGRWEGRDEGQEVAQEIVYTVVDSATGERRDGALGETGFQRLQARLVGETQGDAAEHEGEVLRSRADEDLDEGGVRLDEARVHGHPRQARDGLYERDVGAVEARDDVHECLEPQAELRDRRWRRRRRIEGGLFDVELVDERVVRLAIPEGFLLQGVVHEREMHVLPETLILLDSGVRGDGARRAVEQDGRGPFSTAAAAATGV